MTIPGQSALDIAREIYRSISLYSPNRTPSAIDLSDNTNLWGIPPQAAAAITNAAGDTVTRYPALYVNQVKEAVSDYLGVTPNMVVTGCGSDDVLDSAIRAFGEPNDIVAHADPSFAMIPIFAKMNGLRAVPIPLTPKFDIDVDVVIASRVKIIYLCSPNNPTGTTTSLESIKQIVDKTTGLVIIDEAYAEFAEQDCLSLLQYSPRVLITRTLSKAFGLAGLRIGYAVGDPKVIAEVEKSRGPYKVNAIAERAAVAALREDRNWVMDRIAEVKVNRKRFAEALQKRGLAPLPSEANFLLVPVEKAVELDTRMRELGVALRPFTDLPGIGDAVRISIGPWPMLQTCLDALDTILSKRSAASERVNL